MRAALLPSRNAAHKITLNPFFFQLISNPALPRHHIITTDFSYCAISQTTALLQYLLNIVSGSLLDLNINLSNILPNKTDSQKLYTSQ